MISQTLQIARQMANYSAGGPKTMDLTHCATFSALVRKN